MAKGRIIRKSIMESPAVCSLKTDTDRLIFTWLITLADCEGRLEKNVNLLTSKLFPREKKQKLSKMEKALERLEAVGLIFTYSVDEYKNMNFIWFPGFERNQPNLRKDREAPSKYPQPNSKDLDAFKAKHPEQFPETLSQTRQEKSSAGDLLRSNSGVTPDKLRSDSGSTPPQSKLNKVKYKHDNIASADAIYGTADSTIRGGAPEALSPEESKSPSLAKYNSLTGRYPTPADRRALTKLKSREDWDEQLALAAMDACDKKARVGKKNPQSFAYYVPAIVECLEKGSVPDGGDKKLLGW